jgi:ribonucleoside-diphosphate reductase alpha chain
MKTRS